MCLFVIFRFFIQCTEYIVLGFIYRFFTCLFIGILNCTVKTHGFCLFFHFHSKCGILFRQFKALFDDVELGNYLLLKRTISLMLSWPNMIASSMVSSLTSLELASTMFTAS